MNAGAVGSIAGGRLRHLPLPLFAVPMGLGGLGLAWRDAARVLGAPALIGEAVLAVMVAVYVLLLLLHGWRGGRHPEALLADLRHPVRAAFAGGISVAAMLSSAALAPYLFGLAQGLWLVGALAHAALAMLVFRRLLAAPGDAAAMMPPLLIPLVGNLLAPTLGVRFGFEALNWALFGIGVGLWVLLQPLLLHRVIGGPPLPPRLRPTLVIFLAPPAVVCLALVALQGGLTQIGLMAFGLTCFTALALLSLAPELAKLPFALSWWGYTFPSAAFAMTCMAFAAAHPVFLPVAWVALLLSSAIIAMVALRTLAMALRGELLQPEP